MKNIKFYILFLGLGLLINANAQDSVLFFEDFDTTTIPLGWEQEYLSGNLNWKFQEGGYSLNPEIPLSKHPTSAYSGNYNAMFHFQSTFQEKTRLITRPITEMEFAVKPELRFFYAQEDLFGTNELRIYYKNGIDSSWVLLDEMTSEKPNWTERIVLLPDSTLSDDYYIAFEGLNKNGWGTCVDHIEIVETGVLDRIVDAVIVEQASIEPVSSGLNDYPILKIKIGVKGNEGNMDLQSINLSSLNTSDDDIKTNGVKLFYTAEEDFNNDSLIHSGVTYSGGQAFLSGINHRLRTGYSYFWLTYDIDTIAEHGNIVDGQILTGEIVINGEGYPQQDFSPTGNRLVYKSVFYDDFETDKGWTLSGEFEIDEPLEKGGLLLNSDPEKALSGINVLGTDLTGLGNFKGDYENKLSPNAYTAISPTIDLTFYKDIKLNMSRWLNIYFNDTVSVDVSNNNGVTWNKVWQNPTAINDDEWTIQSIDLSSYLFRKTNSKIRISLGGTDTTTQISSGWNIDDLSITGDYILNDVGISTITAPITGCGHSDQDVVTTVVKNFGPVASEDTIPLAYSLDGGSTYQYDTLFGSIPFAGSVNFSFSAKADLEEPGLYNIRVKTLLEVDEDNSNDQFDTSIYVVPEVALPYSQSFDNGTGHWRSGGNRKVWEWGKPVNTNINSAASGQYAWVTDLNSYLQKNDSVFVESPCFNFTGIRNPVLECKVNTDALRYKEGAAFYYSIDEGFTWLYMDTLDYRWDWNWYADTVTSHGLPAIDSVSKGWVSMKQFMPLSTINQSNVKIRMLFKADTITNFSEGIGLDDFNIIEAPLDVGIVDFIAPDSACELSNKEFIKVAVKNYAIDTLFAGTQIPLAFDLNSSYYTSDTLVLSTDLAPLDTVHFIFTDSVNMFSAGYYYFDVYSLLDGDTDYYNESTNNDTLTTYVRVYGMPEYDLGPAIGMEVVDTIIDAGAGFASYDWESGDSTTQLYHVTIPGTYNVVITNSHGCVKEDSIKVLESVEDLGVLNLASPLSDCEFTSDTVVSIQIKNFRAFVYPVDTTILLGYTLNGSREYVDTITLSSGLGIEDTLDYTLKGTFDFSEFTDYNFEFYTKVIGDLDYTNDTLTATISAYGYPDVEIGPDTIMTSKADTIIFDAGIGFDTYLWQDGSSTVSFSVTDKTSKKYTIEVTDVNGCGTDKDSVQIIAYNLGINSFASPVNSCELSSIENIRISIVNKGQDTIVAGTNIPVSYQLDEGVVNSELMTLVADLYPDKTVSHLFATTEDMSAIGSYSLKATCSLANDIDKSNDTLQVNISNWGYPIVDLGPDTIYTHRFDTVWLVADPGYAYYEWSTGILNDSLNIPNGGSKWYSVLVSNSNGCITYDSTYIFTHDVGIFDIASPNEACELTNSETVQVSIKNHGISKIPTGTTIPLWYNNNNGTSVWEDFVLPTDLNSGSSLSYTFSQELDMSSTGTYNIKASTALPHDVYSNNNLMSRAVNAYGYPEIDLGMDTLFTNRTDTVTLNAGEDYSSYLWNTGDVTETISAEPHSELYKVRVQKDHGGFSCTTWDSIFIYAKDIGVKSVVSPQSSCELANNEVVSIKVINHSADTFPSGNAFNVSYQLDANTPVSEVLILAFDLLPGDSITYNFSVQADFSDFGDHILKTYTSFGKDVDLSNDTLVQLISRHGYPMPILNGDTIFTNEPETLVLETVLGYAVYQWNTGETTAAKSVTDANSAMYKVYVESQYGCGSYDSVYVYAKDLEMDGILSPISNCELSGNEAIIVSVANSSSDTIRVGDQIDVAYQLNAMNPIYEQITLSTDLLPGESLEYTFNNKADFSQIGSHNISAWVAWNNDVDPSNDDADESVQVYGYPTVYLGADTVIRSLQYTLDAGGPFDAYLWQDASTDQTFTLTESGSFNIQVTDGNGCSDFDTINISLLMPDFSISQLINPVSQCYSNGVVNPMVRLENTGTDTIKAGELIEVGYYVNDVFKDREVFEMATALEPGDSVEVAFTSSVDVLGYNEHDFKLFTVFDRDLYPDNDTIAFQKNILPYPVVNLGNDTTLKSKHLILEAPENENYSYEWQDGQTDSQYEVVYDGGLQKKYKVTVTDNRLSCSTQDEITIIFRITDVEINSVGLPAIICQYGPSEVTVSIKNVGNSIITSGKELVFGYQVNNIGKAEFYANTSSSILTGQSADVVFNDVAFSHSGENDLKLYVVMADDDDKTNDTINMPVSTDMAPEIILGGLSDSLSSVAPVVLIPTQGEAAYKWKDGSTSTTYSANSSGWYWVDITGSNGCAARDSVYIDAITSVNSLALSNIDVEVYPVPASKTLNIKSKGFLTKNYDYAIFSNDGRMVLYGQLAKNQVAHYILNIENFSPGLYYLKVFNNDQVYTKKLLFNTVSE